MSNYIVFNDETIANDFAQKAYDFSKFDIGSNIQEPNEVISFEGSFFTMVPKHFNYASFSTGVIDPAIYGRYSDDQDYKKTPIIKSILKEGLEEKPLSDVDPEEDTIGGTYATAGSLDKEGRPIERLFYVSEGGALYAKKNWVITDAAEDNLIVNRYRATTYYNNDGTEHHLKNISDVPYPATADYLRTRWDEKKTSRTAIVFEMGKVVSNVVKFHLIAKYMEDQAKPEEERQGVLLPTHDAVVRVSEDLEMNYENAANRYIKYGNPLWPNIIVSLTTADFDFIENPILLEDGTPVQVPDEENEGQTKTIPLKSYMYSKLMKL